MLERKDVHKNDTWDHEALYSTSQEWESAFSALKGEISKIEKYRGKLSESASILAEALDCSYGLSRELEKIYTYAKLLSDVDIANASCLGNVQQAANLASKLTAASSYMKPEILAIPAETMKEFLASPELSAYKRVLEDLARYRAHTLSDESENILALGNQALGAADKIYTQLCNVDMDFGTIAVKGEEKTISHGSYGVLIKNPDRGIRSATQEKYYGEYDAHKSSLSAALTGSYQKDVFLSRARNFKSCVERGLFTDNIDPSVYTNLVDTVSNNLHSLHRYYAIRKKALQLEEQRLYDTYVPLVSSESMSITYDQAVGYLCDALAPLGEEYVSTLHRGLTSERWVDRYENKGKRSGAYSGGCYDSYPYILISYKEDDIRSMFTLAHEAGHSMHTWLANQSQPYQYHSYSIFVAEVASTFNEALLNRHLQTKWAGEDAKRLYLVNQQIDDIKATLHRQTMFAEFELEAHRIIEEDQPLTLEVFSGIYEALLKKYFGEAVLIEGLDSLEFLRIPHFYWSFYVYKYATGISAALALSNRVLEGGDAEREDYLNFLRAGSSLYPLEALGVAGIDMSSPEPVAQACARFESLVDELESLI